MSRRRAGNVGPLAKRLRFLRGKLTQEEFAERIGISRSALANYETGRSVPDDYTLTTIAANAGVHPSYFEKNVDPLLNENPAATLGAIVEGLPDWTDDEAALVRMLRLCDDDTVSEVLDAILRGVSGSKAMVTISAIYTVQDDLARLMAAHDNTGTFSKGSLSVYPEGSPLHRFGYKWKSPK